MIYIASNPRSALGTRAALCLHIDEHWPGGSESGRSALNPVCVTYVDSICGPS